MIHVHFLGIGGSGASAIAAIAQAQGFATSGCDKNPHNEFTKAFSKDKLFTVFTGHSPSHLPGGTGRTPREQVNILAVTPAIFSLDPNNPELLAAKNQNIPVMTWQQFMGEYLEKDKFVIAVCGTHGKSTTTAMIGQLLEDANLDPTVELGAVVPKWKANYRVGRSGYFITEADEFNDNFLVSHPNITVVTTIEMDHPEYFKDFEDYKKSFAQFFSQTKDKIIANLSDPGVKTTLASQASPGSVVVDYSKQLIDFPLQVPGKYNVLNASAAYQLGLALGIDPQVIQQSLQNYQGISRRFEYLGNKQSFSSNKQSFSSNKNGAEVYSDFGHHPTEIKVTLQAAREKFPDKNITVIFQPHMFSRTHALFNDFVQVLKNAPVDRTFIMDIYPSREVDTGLVTSKQLVEAIAKKNIEYISNPEELFEKLNQDVQGILFFIGAGNTDKWAREFLE